MPEKEDLRMDDAENEQNNAPKTRQPPPRRPEYANRNQGGATVPDIRLR